MDALRLTQFLALVGAFVCVVGIALRLREILDRPFKRDLSTARGSARRGVLFAFTLGMAPWEKESTRMHWLAYLRGIFFHVGVFAGLAILLLSPWITAQAATESEPASLFQAIIWVLAILSAAGAIFAIIGIPIRLYGENERALSLPDDYFSVLLVSLFAGFAALAALLPAAMPWFYLLSTGMLIYIPFSKIRHCVYFFYSKFFFGLSFGHRGVLGQPAGEYKERGSHD